MAFDSEELNKRRELRKKQQEQRIRQQRKLRLQLLCAVAVLVVCGGLIYGISQEKPLAPDTPANLTANDPPQTEAPESVPPTTEKKQEPFTTIHIAAMGDLNVTDNIISAGNLGTNFDHMFLDILPLISEADLTLLNYEGTLSGPPYGSLNASAPDELMTALARSGVDAIQLANSYSIRTGMTGLANTIQGVRKAGLEPLGVYATSQEAKRAGGYSIMNVGGLKVALVAFTKGMDGMALPSGSEGCVNLLYTDYSTHYQKVAEKEIRRILKAAQEEKPDITIAMLHWGSEFNDTISGSQKRIRDLMFSEGVDVILGTHSHYVQQVEFDKDAGTLVCYSLGDFLSDGVQPGTEYSAVMDIEITRDNDTGISKVTGYTYTPVFTSTDNGTIRLLRIREAMMAYENKYIDSISKQTYDAMKNALERIDERIHSEVKETEE